MPRHPPKVAYSHHYEFTITDYVPLEDGGMAVVFTPVEPGPGGRPVPRPPQVWIPFDAEAWERFQGEVARNGERSGLVTARSLPAQAAPRFH